MMTFQSSISFSQWQVNPAQLSFVSCVLLSKAKVTPFIQSINPRDPRKLPTYFLRIRQNLQLINSKDDLLVLGKTEKQMSLMDLRSRTREHNKISGHGLNTPPQVESGRGEN